MHLRGFQGLSLYDVFSFLGKQVTLQGLTERAAAISYNLVMAIPPSLLIFIAIIPHLPFISRKNIVNQIHELIHQIIPSREYNENIIAFVDNFFESTQFGVISFGFIFALFFSSNAVIGIMRSFNRKYHGFTELKGLKRRGRALKLTLILYGLLLAYLVLLIMQGQVLGLITKSKILQTLIVYLRWAFIVGLLFLTISFIYRYAPALQKRWKFVNPGSILATTLCIMASFGFSLFVTNFGRYNALYGAIGTIMMVMALIFINALALLIGFELNASISSLKAEMLRREAQENEPYTESDGIFE